MIMDSSQLPKDPPEIRKGEDMKDGETLTVGTYNRRAVTYCTDKNGKLSTIGLIPDGYPIRLCQSPHKTNLDKQEFRTGMLATFKTNLRGSSLVFDGDKRTPLEKFAGWSITLGEQLCQQHSPLHQSA